jgi:hypothetical protein
MQVSKPKNKKSLRHKIYFALFIVFAGLVIAACVSTITILNQDSSVTPGDTAHMVINLQWASTNYDRNDRQIVGICVPKGWNAAQNTTMTYKSDVGDGKMVLIPDGITDPATKLSYPAAFAKKFGIGPNYINDMEWVAFWSDVKLSVANQSTVNGQIYINIKTGTDNLSFKPGYAMCEDEDGLSDANSGYYTSLFGDCMLVAAPDADDIQDFCNPQIGVADPASATDNDIVTITYNGSLDTSALKNAGDIYFCAKGYTTTGEVIDKCQQTEATKLTLSGLQQWRIDFWPKKLFNLQQRQSLSKIEYYFMNKEGTIKTGYGNTTDPFKYNFKCK